MRAHGLVAVVLLSRWTCLVVTSANSAYSIAAVSLSLMLLKLLALLARINVTSLGEKCKVFRVGCCQNDVMNGQVLVRACFC